MAEYNQQAGSESGPKSVVGGVQTRSAPGKLPRSEKQVMYFKGGCSSGSQVGADDLFIVRPNQLNFLFLITSLIDLFQISKTKTNLTKTNLTMKP